MCNRLLLCVSVSTMGAELPPGKNISYFTLSSIIFRLHSVLFAKIFLVYRRVFQNANQCVQLIQNESSLYIFLVVFKIEMLN